MRVFGYTRFSFWGQSDVRLSRLVTGEEQFNLLYHPDRMAQRFHMFENIFLPSINAQTNKDFKLFLLTSPKMPEQYTDRLKHLVDGHPNIEIYPSDAPRVHEALNEKISDIVNNTDRRTAHFRLDDDDAIGAHVIDNIYKNIDTLPKNGIITFPRGLFLMQTDTELHLVRKFEDQIAIAFAFINDPGEVRNPYSCDHRTYYQNVSSLTIAERFSYIHCAYESCDTEPAQKRKLKKAISQDTKYQEERAVRRINRILSREFPTLPRERLEEIMATRPEGKKTAVWIHKAENDT